MSQNPGKCGGVWRETFPYFSLGYDVVLKNQPSMIKQAKKVELVVFSFECKTPGQWIQVICQHPNCGKKLFYWQLRKSAFRTSTKQILCCKHSKK